MPTWVFVAGYLAVAGSVATAVSQTAIPIDEDADADDDPLNHVDIK